MRIGITLRLLDSEFNEHGMNVLCELLKENSIEYAQLNDSTVLLYGIIPSEALEILTKPFTFTISIN